MKINNPDDIQIGGDHYQKMDIQPWRALESWQSPEKFEGFLQGSIIKYLARYPHKGKIQDLYKARHVLEKLIRFKETNESISKA